MLLTTELFSNLYFLGHHTHLPSVHKGSVPRPGPFHTAWALKPEEAATPPLADANDILQGYYKYDSVVPGPFGLLTGPFCLIALRRWSSRHKSRCATPL